MNHHISAALAREQIAEATRRAARKRRPGAPLQDPRRPDADRFEDTL